MSEIKHLNELIVTHHYISTACQHGLHDRCRHECKFCAEKCACECGHAKIAADFTCARERQIAETREDIAWVEAQIWADSEHDSPTNSDAPKRILAMLNAKLEMLTRGMKQEAGKSDE